MKTDQSKQLKWELTRERFGIEARFPPAAQRPEKCIGEILRDIIGEQVPHDAPIPKTLIENWSAIVGPQVAQHSAPAYVRNSILHIFANHPGWLSELKRLPKQLLLKRFSSVQQLPEIKDIRCQLDPAIQTQKRPAASGRPQSRNKA